MSPEVVRGEAAPTRFSDLYALSVLLFMMFMINRPLQTSCKVNFGRVAGEIKV